MITSDQLRQIMPNATHRIDTFLDPLNAAMEEFEINTPKRQAAFLGQISHESGELRYVQEIASGGAYEGREDLGNIEPGDGIKYKGRGLLQITGRYGYEQCGTALGLDLIDNPELLELPDNACRSASWWWWKHGCNQLADAENYALITRRINGGMNGYADRVVYWERAQDAIA